MNNIKYICPCCGKDITAEVMAEAVALDKERFREVQRLGGSVSGKINGAKLGAKYGRQNIKKANEAYTPEKRRAAALKAWETKRRKSDND